MTEIAFKFDLLSDNSLKQSLEKLQENSTPTFGDMTPQQMIEHLTKSVEISYTKPYSPEKAITEMQKQTRLMFLNTENPFPKGLKSPMYKEGMPALIHQDLAIAKNAFLVVISNFRTHFEKNPNSTYYHLLFGEVNFDDLELFHYKHILHHFQQFNLV